MKRTVLLLLVFGFVFFGCISFDDYLKEAGAQNFTTNITYKNLSGNCYCFVCKDSGTDTAWPFSLLYNENLKGGSCSFMAYCNETSLNDSMKNNYLPMPFMLGMGPRPWDFSYANHYCNNSLQFMVHWLHSDGTTYAYPSNSEAECFLEKQVLPVYVFYSNSEAVDEKSAKDFAESLKASGPVILVAEIDYDSSKPEVVEKVKKQILAMREACPRPSGFSFGILQDKPYCMIAVAPKMGDYKALDEMLKDPEINQSVDLVAVGVNSHYLNSSECKSATLYSEAIDYSSYAWHTYKKPVLWAYMLFDESGGNKQGTCEWSKYEVNEAYYEFYSTVMPAAMDAGVIGAAPYQFYAVGKPTDPLDCADCGLITVEGAELKAKEPLFSSWFYGCQKYIPEQNYMLVSFANESEGTCNVGFTGGLFLDQKITTGNAAGLYNASSKPEPEAFSCLSCIASCEGENCDSNPYKIPTVSGASEKCIGFEELDLWATIRGLDPNFVRATAWAESGLDTVDPKKSYCAVSFPVGINNQNCNKLQVLQFTDPSGQCKDELEEYYNNKINGKTVDDINTNEIEYIENELATSSVKPCATGLMQINTDNGGYPFTYWSSDYGTGTDLGILYSNSPLTYIPPEYAEDIIPKYYEDSKYRKAAASCAKDGKFNPFNGNHSACLGTWILKQDWEEAEAWVNTHATELGVKEGENLKTKKDWITAFIATYKYIGYTDSKIDIWLNNFNARKEITCGGGSSECCSGSTPKNNACCGNKDNFIQFVSCCTDYNANKGTAYTNYCAGVEDGDRVFESSKNAHAMEGLRRLVMYNSLNKNCDEKTTCGNPEKLLENINLYTD